jgi:hypothetical protein
MVPFFHALEPIPVGDVVDDPREPGHRVGKCAVKVEDSKLIAHKALYIGRNLRLALIRVPVDGARP